MLSSQAQTSPSRRKAGDRDTHAHASRRYVASFLPRASLAICRLLIQDSLMAGVNVLNTAVKNVGRPDLPGGTERRSVYTTWDHMTSSARCTRSPDGAVVARRHQEPLPQPCPGRLPCKVTTDLSCFPGSCSWIRQQSAARISSSFFKMSLCKPDVQSWATDWFKFCEGNTHERGEGVEKAGAPLTKGGGQRGWSRNRPGGHNSHSAFQTRHPLGSGQTATRVPRK